jgi:hypothetical protein
MASYTIKLDADDRDLDRTIDRAAQKLDNLDAKAGDIGIGGRSGSGMGAGRGGGSRGVTLDPWARHESALEDLRFQKSAGLADDQLKAERLAVINSSSAVDRAERKLAGKSPGDRLMDAIGTTRIGPGGAYPLINRLASVVGSDAVAALGVAGGVAYAGNEAIQAGMASNRSLQAAHYISGGTMAETGALGSLGAFLGRSPEQEAMVTEAFGDSLHGSTFGAGYFRSRGITDYGGLTTDKATNYLRAARQLAEEPNEALAIRVARDTGMQDELRLRDLSRTTREMTLGNMNAATTRGEIRAQAEYDANVANLNASVGRIWRGVSYPAVTLGNDILDPVGTYNANRAAGIADVVARSNNPEQRPRSRDQIIKDFNDKYHPDSAKHEAKVDEQKHAVKAAGPDGSVPVAQSVRTQSGISGGGPRVSSAFPAAARNQQYSENAEAYGKYIGGYPG